MRCLNLFPLAFCSLALAQDTKFVAATLYAPDNYEFNIYRYSCTNLKKTQPIFTEIEVGALQICELYADLKCSGEYLEVSQGTHAIGDVQFKSVYCEATWDDDPDESL
ncbi:hypothetical protein IF1G_07533 [Cordyceps javanica]|uniref:Uncharacterized protein n=1 Tax=Cordyceps javanica TaxID=43265 RepID=A0A545VS74_9HYPO|nr:hypothetical protein IF1G_07533 [Cordyceps javanica]TQW04581.1 hypothetical protein IF2G_07810 [Cordyceps javanica]